MLVSRTCEVEETLISLYCIPLDMGPRLCMPAMHRSQFLANLKREKHEAAALAANTFVADLHKKGVNFHCLRLSLSSSADVRLFDLITTLEQDSAALSVIDNASSAPTAEGRQAWMNEVLRIVYGALHEITYSSNAVPMRTKVPVKKPKKVRSKRDDLRPEALKKIMTADTFGVFDSSGLDVAFMEDLARGVVPSIQEEQGAAHVEDGDSWAILPHVRKGGYRRKKGTGHDPNAPRCERFAPSRVNERLLLPGETIAGAQMRLRASRNLEKDL